MAEEPHVTRASQPQVPAAEPASPPKNPLELVLALLWRHRWGRFLTIALGLLALVGLAAQGIDPLIRLFAYVSAPKAVKADIPEYVKDGYYVGIRRTVFEMGSWRELTSAQENEKTSLVVCINNFTIYREKPEAVSFIHRISSTGNVDPEVFCDRGFTKSPVEGYTEMGKTRIWEISIDIHDEPLHRPINLQFVVFFWNNFNRKDQWDLGTRIYNSRTDHAEIAVRFPHWKPAHSIVFETRSPTGDKSRRTTITPNPAGVLYDKDEQGNIFGVTWLLLQPSEDKTYWIAWNWTANAS